MVTKTNLEEDTIEFVIYGGSQNTPAAITATTPVKGFLSVPLDCEWWKWRLVGDVAGSIVLDIWQGKYADFPPTVLDTIAGTGKPTLSSAQANESIVSSDSTRHLVRDRVLAVNVEAGPATVQRVTLTLFVKRSKVLA